MTRLIRRIVPRRGHWRRRIIDQGQAMFLVIAVMGILVAVPVAVNLLALNQVPTSEEALLAVQAKQAAVTGISDYINHVQAASSYTQYCSKGMTSWTCPAGTAAPTASNPAFVDAPTLVGKWYSDGLTMRGVSNGTPSYRYVVNSPNSSNPALVTIYSIGQAGTQTGLHVTSTEEAALTVCSGGCVAPVTAASCIKVPNGAVSAKIVAYGATGGGTGTGNTDASGGVGAVVTSTVPVTAGDTLNLVDGQAGYAGNGQLLNILQLFPNSGGLGGTSPVGSCLLPNQTYPLLDDLGGGNGAIPGGLADAATYGGGGGGGATIVYDATQKASTQLFESSQGTPLVVAGGGGGGGAGNLITYLGTLLPILGDPPGAGGATNSTLSSPAQGGAGVATPGLTVTIAFIRVSLFGGSPGGAGGTWTAGGPAPCASATTPGGTGAAPGNECGQNGYIPNNLLSAVTGGGGGGGGGFSSLGIGGGGGGTTGGLLTIAGSGAGGGSGSSYANNGCPGTTTIGPATTYPAGDTTGTGQISITFYSSSCGGTALTTVNGTIRAASPPS